MNWKWLAIIPSVIFTWLWQDFDSAPLSWDTTEYFFGAEKILARIQAEPLWRAPLALLFERPFRFNSISIFLLPFWAATQEIASATKYFSISSLIFCSFSLFLFLKRWVAGWSIFISALTITTLPIFFTIAQQPYAEILFLGFYLCFLHFVLCEEQTRNSAIAAGFCLGVAATLRPAKATYLGFAARNYSGASSEASDSDFPLVCCRSDACSKTLQ